MPEGNDTPRFEPTMLGAMWRFRWLVLVLLIGGAALGVVYARLQPARYSAEASFVVQDPRASSVFETGAGQQPARFVADQVAILESTVVAERAAQSAVEAGVALSADDLLDYSKVISNPESSLIGIQFEADTVEYAMFGANFIADAYRAILRESTAQNYASALEQLDQSISGVAEELIGIGEDITARLAPDPAREELNRQFTEALTRLAELQAGSCRGAGGHRSEHGRPDARGPGRSPEAVPNPPGHCGARRAEPRGHSLARAATRSDRTPVGPDSASRRTRSRCRTREHRNRGVRPRRWKRRSSARSAARYGRGADPRRAPGSGGVLPAGPAPSPVQRPSPARSDPRCALARGNTRVSGRGHQVGTAGAGRARFGIGGSLPLRGRRSRRSTRGSAPGRPSRPGQSPHPAANRCGLSSSCRGGRETERPWSRRTLPWPRPGRVIGCS